MVIWLIGLSGSGKTTLAQEVVSLARARLNNVVLLDGDVIRELFGHDLGYTLVDRRRNADRISQLCQFLDLQGIHVVCAILSLFQESRDWNRQHIRNYYEVFIDAPMEQLVTRDSKNLYSRALRGEIRDVAGVDLKFFRPVSPDMVIHNAASQKDLLSYASKIAHLLTGQSA